MEKVRGLQSMAYTLGLDEGNASEPLTTFTIKHYPFINLTEEQGFL